MHSFPKWGLLVSHNWKTLQFLDMEMLHILNVICAADFGNENATFFGSVNATNIENDSCRWFWKKSMLHILEKEYVTGFENANATVFGSVNAVNIENEECHDFWR